MKKQMGALLMALVMAAGFVPALEISTAAASEQAICDIESAEPGRILLSNIGMDIACRLVLPDGTRTSWNVRGEYDDDFIAIAPLDGGDYYLETCPLSALTVLDAESDYLPDKYDLWTAVPASEIYTSEKIAVAQPEDEGDNIVDLAEGDVLLSSSYNDYAVFANEYNLYDSDLDFSVITDAPAIRYVSTDDGMTWKKLTGSVTLTSSAAEPVEGGVSYALYCGDYPTTLTLDNVRTNGTIYTAPFGDTIVEIKGDVIVKRLDTDYLGKLTIRGADSSAKLAVTAAIISSCIEIRDLAELKIEGNRIAINGIMGDVKLTNIPKLDITVSSEVFASGICCYDGNVIFTDVFGVIDLPNDPEGKVLEIGEGKQFIINTSGASIQTGADREHLQTVELQTEATDGEKIPGIFPMDKMGTCLLMTSSAEND